MPSIRRHPITGEPILFAPERAGRPQDDGASRCPFCPGHESDTPPEILRRGDPWRVRVFPNKYPAAKGHEVIVESAEHDASFEDLRDPAEVIGVYAERYRAHRESAPCVALFKNHGPGAGASLRHQHSQLIPLPFVPPVIERHLLAFRDASSCPLCTGAQSALISENDTFRRVAPQGSWHTWEQWLVPRRHHSDFDPTADEKRDLASLLQEATAAARRLAGSYNVLLFGFRGEDSAHFYVSVFPRLSAVAGFELGTGTFIDLTEPTGAARRLR